MTFIFTKIYIFFSLLHSIFLGSFKTRLHIKFTQAYFFFIKRSWVEILRPRKINFFFGSELYIVLILFNILSLKFFFFAFSDSCIFTGSLPSTTYIWGLLLREFTQVEWFELELDEFDRGGSDPTEKRKNISV